MANNKITRVNHEFEIFINLNSKILILGSMPSILSRKHSFYYMNKTNRFYKVLANVFSDDLFLNEDITIKKKALDKHNIALFDVISECDIINSSDASISNIVVNDINKIVKDYNITKIILNGSKAYEIFIKYFPNLDDISIKLPSTSAANASFSLAKLIDKWNVLKDL